MAKMSLKENPFYCQVDLFYSDQVSGSKNLPLLYSFIYNCEHVEPHEAVNQYRDEGPTELFL